MSVPNFRSLSFFAWLEVRHKPTHQQTYTRGNTGITTACAFHVNSIIEFTTKPTVPKYALKIRRMPRYMRFILRSLHSVFIAKGFFEPWEELHKIGSTNVVIPAKLRKSAKNSFSTQWETIGTFFLKNVRNILFLM